jgi:hypothetical protein
MMRWDIINHFIKKYGYKDYLEIGYYKGWSFDRIECQNKAAVDPNPSKTLIMEQVPHGTLIDTNIFKKTSDEFFASITPSSKWDIIFIDGLHEAVQVKRDFENALKHLSPNGTIVLHDCNPSSYVMTTNGTANGEWTGDVYKTAVYLRHIYPYNFYTVDTDYGVGVYRDTELSEYWGNIFGSAYMGNISWDSFDVGRKDLLNLISVEEFNKREKIDI